ncbi:glycosyltransferase family 2 protein [Allorhodopirellula heiligendammensis]|uniref:Glycosyl transferase family 2 n=1 Tax=Allorhodopirellula heiligendammensis TaxID=2714739 RepID=A0A5C6C0F3_9BACT|nr:glycosyltransferase family 2 protein [Allorhodopirellula heiligendammensis]TWU16996.1 Glycosyl transferase family 2 [Allorhodopirellula heiligendammensis]
MNLSHVTALILTYNEEANLRTSLGALDWASRIVIVDSGSSDRTRAIAAEFSHVDLFHRDFDNHTNQWNFGLSKIDSEWVLALDADYVFGSDFPLELEKLETSQQAFDVQFRYCVYGRPLHASLYPPRVVLFRPAHCTYIADGHTQTLDVSEVDVGHLASIVSHDDHKSLARWCSSQIKYANLEADKLLAGDSSTLGWKDRLRKRIVFAPWLTLFYCLFVKRLVRDGWAGCFYSLQRVFAELLLSLVLIERKFPERVSSSRQVLENDSIKDAMVNGQ